MFIPTADTVKVSLMLGMIFKRIFDLIASAVALVILAPLILLLGIAVWLSSPGPIIFKHRRVGLDGKHIKVFKFRTMTDGAEALGRETSGTNDPRITRLGGYLRQTKLDELPQLINVLCGQMSLVGPRPEIPFYVERYCEDDRVVLTMRPGITDPSTLEMADLDSIMQSRGTTSAAEFYEREVLPRKLALQRQYIAERTFFGDISILIRTVFRIIYR